jgi:hypothetical protein
VLAFAEMDEVSGEISAGAILASKLDFGGFTVSSLEPGRC